MKIGLIDYSNECNFAIEIFNNACIEQVKSFMKIGLAAWYEAAHDDIEGNLYFDRESIESFYGAGYAEPTYELLNRYGIEFRAIDIEFNNEDEAINLDEVVYY